MKKKLFLVAERISERISAHSHLYFMMLIIDFLRLQILVIEDEMTLWITNALLSSYIQIFIFSTDVRFRYKNSFLLLLLLFSVIWNYQSHFFFYIFCRRKYGSFFSVNLITCAFTLQSQTTLSGSYKSIYVCTKPLYGCWDTNKIKCFFSSIFQFNKMFVYKIGMSTINIFIEYNCWS